MEILMLKGLPGSGKSTWAKDFVEKNPGWVRVNKDSLREMMAGYRSGKDEGLILEWRNILIRSALLRGKSVVVDDTNFHPKHEAQLRMIAENMGLLSKFQVEVRELKFDTPLNDCIKNDLKRPNSVGEKVIRKMYNEYLAPKIEKQPWISGLPSAIICDLDGTLAIHNGRSPYDIEKCDTDIPDQTVLAILGSLTSYQHHTKLLFVTGREEKYREKTLTWLKKHGPTWIDALWMRPTGDMREDSIVKQEIYEREIKGKYNVGFILDDRNRVVEMWRRNGLKCLQVADGNF